MSSPLLPLMGLGHMECWGLQARQGSLGQVEERAGLGLKQGVLSHQLGYHSLDKGATKAQEGARRSLQVPGQAGLQSETVSRNKDGGGLGISSVA